ncbi:MAG: transcription antitermination factor NusB [bacterium]
MGKRRAAREFALQILYQVDLVKVDADKALDTFWSERKPSKEIKDFTNTLVRGVGQNLKMLDDQIGNVAEKWDISRMSTVDRNILRFGSFEIFFLSDVPVSVTINEAVEIAKKYSTIEAAKFINGILDKIAKLATGKK